MNYLIQNVGLVDLEVQINNHNKSYKVRPVEIKGYDRFCGLFWLDKNNSPNLCSLIKTPSMPW